MEFMYTIIRCMNISSADMPTPKKGNKYLLLGTCHWITAGWYRICAAILTRRLFGSPHNSGTTPACRSTTYYSFRTQYIVVVLLIPTVPVSTLLHSALAWSSCIIQTVLHVTGADLLIIFVGAADPAELSVVNSFEIF
jgi:hypothetical protein